MLEGGGGGLRGAGAGKGPARQSVKPGRWLPTPHAGLNPMASGSGTSGPVAFPPRWQAASRPGNSRGRVAQPGSSCRAPYSIDPN